MPVGVVLLVILLFLAVGSAPYWSHSRGWGHGPAGVFTVLFLAVAVLLLTRGLVW